MLVIKLVSERKGDHVHEKVFVGEEGQTLMLAGNLVWRIDEWQLFEATLGLGAKQTKDYLKVIFVGDEKVCK